MVFKKVLLVVFLLYSFVFKAQIKYPPTKKKPVVNRYHSVEITDDYQWLEDAGSPEVVDWVKDQNKIAVKYLHKLANSNGARAKMESFLWSQMEYDNLVENKKDQEYYFKLMYPGRDSPLNIY
jgi:prolyl oligopeptidase